MEKLLLGNNEQFVADDLLNRAQSSWNAMNRYRQDRDRCKRFTYGDQWSDSYTFVPAGLGEVEFVSEK